MALANLTNMSNFTILSFWDIYKSKFDHDKSWGGCCVVVSTCLPFSSRSLKQAVKVDLVKVDPVEVDPVEVDPVKVDPVEIDPVEVDPVKQTLLKYDRPES